MFLHYCDTLIRRCMAARTYLHNGNLLSLLLQVWYSPQRAQQKVKSEENDR